MAKVAIHSPVRLVEIKQFLPIFAAVSLLACVAVGGLWWRAQSGQDEATWQYDRYLADGSAASNSFSVTSDKRRLSLSVRWGHVGPFNGQLVYGYYLNADQSGGRPRFTFSRDPYDFIWNFTNAHADQGALPVQWEFARHTKAAGGDDFCSLNISASHWLIALVLLFPSLFVIGRLARRSRAR